MCCGTTPWSLIRLGFCSSGVEAVSVDMSRGCTGNIRYGCDPDISQDMAPYPGQPICGMLSVGGLIAVLVFKEINNPSAYNTRVSPSTKTTMSLVSSLNPWALYIKCDLPIRAGLRYGSVFRGQSSEAEARIQKCTPTPAGFLPLWKGVIRVPDIEIEDTPFVWKCGGVEYRSSCVAFEKNMVMAETAARLWNTAHSPNRDQNLDRLREARAILHHLLAGGLEDDRSLPADPRYQPRCLRRGVLEDLNNAVFSVILQHLADGVQVMKYSDELSMASLRHFGTLKESTFLKKAWYNRQKSLAVGQQGCAYVRQAEEAMPSKELCLSAYRLLGQAALERGCPDANRFRGAQAVCLADLKVVFGFSEAELKRVKSEKPGHAIPEYIPPQIPDWVAEPPDIVALSGDAIDVK